MSVDRRALLHSLAAAALAAAGGRAFAANAVPSTDAAARFAATSAALTGYPAADAADTAKLLAAFATPERRASLARLDALVASTPAAQLAAALRAQGLDGIADDLVAAWYSGVVAQGKQQKLVLYADAYMWSAMSFTKPMGQCGGVTGYWADPPK
jgi:hypothetical protein